jgi:DNA-directed RNA polymerase subunit RPC12/RpoP
MLPQIVCLSCGYHRTWSTLLEALADGRRHAEHPPKTALPESLDRRCPYCKSDRIAPGGRITAVAGMITLELWCGVCGMAFLIVGKTPLA